MSVAVNKTKVLIVDDSPTVLECLTRIFNATGRLQVIGTARNGKEAVDFVRHTRPDIITMDITMPGMDGVETTRRLVAEFPDARVVMLTAHGQERMVIDALDAGAVGYVLKPVRPERLDDMFKTVMARSG